MSGHVHEEVKVNANCPAPVCKCKPDSGANLPRHTTILSECQPLPRYTSHPFHPTNNGAILHFDFTTALSSHISSVCMPDSGDHLPRHILILTRIKKEASFFLLMSGHLTTLSMCQLRLCCISHTFHLSSHGAIPRSESTKALFRHISSVCMPDSEDYLPRPTSNFFWFIYAKNSLLTVCLGRLLIVPLLPLLRARCLFTIGTGPGAGVVGF
jgi:hypothetical protein